MGHEIQVLFSMCFVVDCEPRPYREPTPVESYRRLTVVLILKHTNKTNKTHRLISFPPLPPFPPFHQLMLMSIGSMHNTHGAQHFGKKATTATLWMRMTMMMVMMVMMVISNQQKLSSTWLRPISMTPGRSDGTDRPGRPILPWPVSPLYRGHC